jgi:hypothetical protein
MASKKITKISDKLDKVNESFTINMLDNGFMIEVGGRKDDDWRTVKLLVSSMEELVVLIKEAAEMERE